MKYLRSTLRISTGKGHVEFYPDKLPLHPKDSMDIHWKSRELEYP